jgi:hypothetical protein
MGTGHRAYSIEVEEEGEEGEEEVEEEDEEQQEEEKNCRWNYKCPLSFTRVTLYREDNRKIK